MNNCHRDPELDGYIGQKVKISFKDDHVLTGYLTFVEEFSSKFNYAKPDLYMLTLSSGNGDVQFRKSLVRRIERI